MNILLNKLYTNRPDLFTEEEVDNLEQQSLQTGQPFQRNQEAGTFNLINTVKELGTGFIEGLTTLPISKWLNDTPRNSIEKIANSMGSLMGFVGWIPNPIGIMSKLGISSFLKATGYGLKAANLSKGVSLGVQFKSPTMWAADKVMGVLNKGLQPALEATSFFNKGKGLIAKDMLEGGIHLGIASAINTAPFYDLSWQTATNERMDAFLQGGIFGAGNRFIGNLFSRNGLVDLTETVTGKNLNAIFKLGETDKNAAYELLKKADTGNKLARVLSSAITFGMPSTIQEQPLELQVYEYLLNGYFGGKEMGIHQKEALNFSKKYLESGQQWRLINPTKLPGFEKLSDKAKDEMLIQSEIQLGGWNHEAETNNAYVSVMSGIKSGEGYQSILAKIRDSSDLSNTQKEKFGIVAIQQKAIEDGLKEGKTVEQITKEIPDIVSQELHNKFFYDIFNRISENITPQVFDNVGYEAINRVNDIEGTFREYGLNGRWYNSINKIADLVSSKEGIQNENVLERLSTTNEVAKIAGNILKDKSITKDTFIKSIKDTLKIEITPNVEQEITRVHNELRQAVPREIYALKQQGSKLEPLSEVTPNKQIRKTEWYPPSELDTIYTGVGELKIWEGKIDGNFVRDNETGKYIREEKYGEIPIYDAINQGRITETEIIVNAFNNGKIIISGRKDDANILFADKFADLTEEKIVEITDILKTKKETIQREFNIPGTKKIIKKDVEIYSFEEGKKRFLEKVDQHKLMAEDTASKLYDTITANNVKGLVEWNFGKEMDIKKGLEIIEANPKSFIINPMDIVKRMQIFNDRSPRLPEEEMIKLTGKKEFSFVILKTAKSGKKDIPWQDESYSYNKKDIYNKIISVLHEAHLDGGVVLEENVFNAMMKVSGYSQDATTAKGVHIFGGDSQLGGFISKLAWHKASHEMSAQMREIGLDGLHLDTTAKQRGNRKLLDWTVKDNKFLLLDDQGKPLNKEMINSTYIQKKSFVGTSTAQQEQIRTQQENTKQQGNVINNTIKANIPQNLVSGVESFGTKQEANSEAKKLLGDNPHSIDMIEAGIRTRTTRSVGEMTKYNVKVGDIVKQFGKSADGTTKNILTRITAIYPKGSPEFLNTWEKEGWTADGIEAIKRFKDGAAAIEFEIINNNQTTSQQKQQVREVFDSNPELANAVYEAAGFVQKNDYTHVVLDESGDVQEVYRGTLDGANKYIQKYDPNAYATIIVTKEEADKYLKEQYPEVDNDIKNKVLIHNWEDIINNSKFKELYNYLKPFVKKEIKVYESELNSEGRYTNGDIYINKNAKINKAQILLHELVHSITLDNLKNNESNYYKKILDLHEKYIKPLTKTSAYGEVTGDYYGVNNIYEFVAEAFTNEEFQKKLNTIKTDKNKTIWQELCDIFRKLLGIPINKNSVLNEVISITDNYLKSSQITPQQKQQAQQLYSSYLDSTISTSYAERGSKQDIEGFKEFVSKETTNNTKQISSPIASLEARSKVNTQEPIQSIGNETKVSQNVSNEATNGIYSSSWDKLTVGMAEDMTHLNQKHTLSAQIQYNIDDEKAIEAMVNYTAPYVVGTEKGQKAFEKYLSSKNDKDLENLDFEEDLGVSQKIEILKRNDNSKLWKKVVAEILHIDTVDNEEILDNDTESYFQNWHEIQGTARKVLDSGIEITPEVLMLPDIRRYFETSTKNWFINKSITPKVKYAWKGTFKIHEPIIASKLKIKPGEIYLDGGLKKQLTMYMGKEITLEKALELSKIKGNPKVEVVVTRIPMDSSSGARVLELKGFVGDEGGGFYVHPEEYVNMGGADNDIDTAFLYWNLPKPVVEYYRSKRDQWYIKSGDKKIFREQKTTPQLLAEKDELYRYDIISQLYGNKYSFEAKQNLGRFLAYGKRLKLFLQLKEKNGKVIINGKEYRVNPKADIDFLVRELVNYSADAADGNRMKSIKEIRKILNKQVFGVYNDKLLFEDQDFKDMGFYDNIRRGRDITGKDFTTIESIIALKNLSSHQTAKGMIPGFQHVLFKKMDLLAKKVIPENLNQNILPEGLSSLLFKFKNMQGVIKKITENKIPKEKRTKEQNDNMEFFNLMKKYTGRIRLGFSPEQYNDHIKKLIKQGYSKQKALAQVEEYKANDLLNLADIIDSIIKGKKLKDTVLGAETVEEIKKKVFDFRNRLMELNEDKINHKVSIRVTKESRELLLSEAKAYKQELSKMDDNGYKQAYFESLLYSSSPGIDIEKLSKMQSDLATLKDSKKIDQLKEKIYKLASKAFVTETKNIFASSDLITPNTIKDRVNVFKALIKEARILDPISYNDFTKVSVDNPFSELLQEKTNIPLLTEPTKNKQEVTRLKSVLLDAGNLKIPVIDTISKRVQEFWNKYPHMRRVFEDHYAVWTYKTQGIYKALSTTTEPEITKFLDHIEALMEIDPKGLALRKLDYFLHPTTIIKNFVGYENGLSIKTVPVLHERANIMMQEIAVPTGRFEKNYTILRMSSLSKEKKLSKIELNFAKHPIVKGFESIPIEDKTFLNDYIEKRRTGLAYNDIEFYAERLKEVQSEYETKYKNKLYQIKIGNKTISMTGESFVKHMDNLYSVKLDEILKDVIINQKEFDEFQQKYVVDDIMMTDKFTTDMMKLTNSNNELPFMGLNVSSYIEAQHLLRKYEFGATKDHKGMSAEQYSYNRDAKEKDKAEYEFLMRYKNDARYKGIFEQIKKQHFTIPPEWFRKGYFPQMDFPQKLVEKQLQILKEKYKEDPKKIKRIVLQMERYMSEGELSDMNQNEDLYKMLDDTDVMTNTKIEHYMGSRSSNLLSRNFDNPIGGYNTDHTAILKYERSLYAQYYNSFSSILTHRNIDKFLFETNHSQNKVGKENAKYWAGFMRNKVRIALGGSSIFPKEMIEDKEYKIQGNPYYFLTDDYYARTSSLFDKFFGIDRKTMPQGLIERRVSRKLAALSNLEAKWSMMSLLASPKAYLTNKLTAHLNTMVGAGFDYWKQAGNLKYLQETLGEHAANWESLKNWIDINGGMESFIRAEAQLHPEFNSAKGAKLVDEIITLLKQGKINSDYTIMELIKKSGLSDTITMKSAWFMRKSEIDARLRAWLAHYLKAREIYDASNYTYDKDDPWLIEQANKGVEATQFLYNVMERPDFAATSLGKILSRFQMFSFNSLLWRKRIAENYHTGTDKSKFERLMAADMVVLALASILPYTIINAALPPPYNYLQQLSDWLFGNKKEREKAFFGAIPYPLNIVQPVLPPSSRIITSLIGLASGDFDSFLSYQVWTMMPFGRIARDTYRAMDNPHLFLEREFGLPYNTIINKIAKTKN